MYEALWIFIHFSAMKSWRVHPHEITNSRGRIASIRLGPISFVNLEHKVIIDDMILSCHELGKVNWGRPQLHISHITLKKGA